MEGSSSAARSWPFFLKVTLLDFGKSIFFNRRLKSPEPCITNNFAHFSKQKIKQMTQASIFPVLYSSKTLLISCRPSEVAQEMPAFRRLTEWYIQLQLDNKFMILIGRLNTEWKMN